MPRFFVPGAPLHIVQRGAHRADTFLDPADFAFYRTCLAFAARKHGLAVHAYVLMTNHVHLLATPDHEASAARTMQAIGRVYVPYFNKVHGRTGTLWEGRYKAAIVDTDGYLLTCMRYIELNPVRANMVTSAADYPWSSYAGNALGSTDDVLTPHALFRELAASRSARQAAWQAMVGRTLSDAEIGVIRDATHNAWAIGNAAFCASVTRAGRRAERLSRGPTRQTQAR